ncbi:PEP-CTERM sorting domain-containing protein [Akkermansiaceae bacterium]|nr:PEP-CTERM sorting domain-containing protein [Akkermansiaceae bacterium]
MKKLLLATSLAASSTAFLQGVTLSLTDVSELPAISTFPQGDHYDFYDFPIELIGGTPITNLRIQYSDDAAPGEHLILETFVLFPLAQVSSIIEAVNTQELYDATVTFSQGVTDVDGEFGDTAFAALHSDFSSANTEIIWTATYLDGSQATTASGIIPEPSGAALLGVGLILGITGRKRVNS